MNEDLKRVIIHEIGHLVAYLLNEKLHGLGEVEKIEIKRVEGFNQVYHKGFIVPVVPRDFDPNMGVINLPERLAVLVYGCFFQCLFLEKKFESCFDCEDSSRHGYDDHRRYINSLDQFYISKEVRIELWDFVGVYFERLVENKKEFNQIFEMDFNRVLTENDNIINANLDLLKETLSDFVENHSTQFKWFVDEIKRIIDWETVKSKK